MKISILFIPIWYRLQMFDYDIKPIKIFSAHREPIHMCNEVSNNDMAITISIFFIPISPHHFQVCVFVWTNTFQYHTLWCQFFPSHAFSAFNYIFYWKYLLMWSFSFYFLQLFWKCATKRWYRYIVFLSWPCNFRIAIA